MGLERSGSMLSLALLFLAGGALATDVESQINSLAEQRSEIAFALMPNMSQWQYLLLPTPTVVKLIGQMVVIASKVDVNIADQAPRSGWKFAQHPDSLRASLLQVGNDGWQAFHTAHKNMDHISLKMLQVPRHIRTALTIIKTVDFKHLSKFLRIPLSYIEKWEGFEAGERCVELAVETESAFTDVMGLTAELSTAVSGSQGKHDILIVEAEAALETAKTQKALMDEQKAFMMQRYEEQKKVVADARRAYEKAIKKIPTGFKAFAMDLIKSVAPSVVGGLMGVPVIPSMGGGSSGGGGGGGGGGRSGGSKGAPSDEARDIHGPIVLQSMKTLSERLPELREYVRQALGEAGEAGAEKIKNFFTGMRVVLHEMAESFATYPNTMIKSMADSVLSTLMKVVSGLEDKVAELGDGVTEKVKKEVMEKVDEAADTLEKLLAAGVASGDTMGMTLPGGGGGKGVGRGIGANERFVAQSRLDSLQGAETRLENVFRDLTAFNKELTAVEVRLTEIDLRRVSLKEVRELLRQVLKILGEIRRLWARLVQFFAIIANRAKILNEDYLGPFLETARLSGDVATDNADATRDSLIVHLKEQALDINTVSHLLHTMARTYVKISERHVLEKLAGLAKLLAARDDAERQRWKTALDTDAVQARNDILRIIRVTRERYGSEVVGKRRQLEAAVRALGGVSAEEQERIAEGLAIAQEELATGGKEIVPANPPDPWNIDDLL